MFVSLFVLWIVLVLAVSALAIYRRMLSQQENDALHVLGPDTASRQQVGLAQKLEQVDKWGKLLTMVAVGYGLILAVAYVYHGWVTGSTLGL